MDVLVDVILLYGRNLKEKSVQVASAILKKVDLSLIKQRDLPPLLCGLSAASEPVLFQPLCLSNIHPQSLSV